MARSSDEIQQALVETNLNAKALDHTIHNSSTTEHPILADVKVRPGGYEDECEEGKLL